MMNFTPQTQGLAVLFTTIPTLLKVAQQFALVQQLP